MLNSILKTKKCRAVRWLIQWTKHMLFVLFYEIHIWSIKSFKRATLAFRLVLPTMLIVPVNCPRAPTELRQTKLLSAYDSNVLLIHLCPLSQLSSGWKLCTVVVTHFVPKTWFIPKYFQVAALMYFHLCWDLIHDSC